MHHLKLQQRNTVQKQNVTDQVVNCIIGSRLAAIDEALSQSRHDVFHQVISEGNRLCFQQFELFFLDRLQLRGLKALNKYNNVNS
jgi:hypothetical protein